jgi:hypothetical protein
MLILDYLVQFVPLINRTPPQLQENKMGLSKWFNNLKAKFYKMFGPEDEPLLDFFSPLIKQVKEEALKLGKNNLQVGLNILKEAAMTAASEAALAPSGQKTKAAEEIFLEILRTKGVTAIHNAQAGLIKAAVAILQSQVQAQVMPITSSNQTQP